MCLSALEKGREAADTRILNDQNHWSVYTRDARISLVSVYRNISNSQSAGHRAGIWNDRAECPSLSYEDSPTAELRHWTAQLRGYFDISIPPTVYLPALKSGNQTNLFYISNVKCLA